MRCDDILVCHEHEGRTRADLSGSLSGLDNRMTRKAERELGGYRGGHSTQEGDGYGDLTG